MLDKFLRARGPILGGCVFFLSCVAARADELKLASVYESDSDKNTTWSIETESCSRLPQWDGSGDPPLSLSDAVRIATASLTPKQRKQLTLYSVSLTLPVSEEDSAVHKIYFYFIEFKNIAGDWGNDVDVVETLDGKIIQPVAVKIKDSNVFTEKLPPSQQQPH